MLLRFRYHFDGDRSTNRLDKPEWYLSHIAALIRSHAPLFLPAAHGVPGSGGAVARLNRHYANRAVSHRAYRHIDTYAELLHALLTPLRRKLASTMPALLDHPSLLAHTVFQALTFDADLETQFPPALSVLSGAGVRKISDDILGNPSGSSAGLTARSTLLCSGSRRSWMRLMLGPSVAPTAWQTTMSRSSIPRSMATRPRRTNRAAPPSRRDPPWRCSSRCRSATGRCRRCRSGWRLWRLFSCPSCGRMRSASRAASMRSSRSRPPLHAPCLARSSQAPALLRLSRARRIRTWSRGCVDSVGSSRRCCRRSTCAARSSAGPNPPRLSRWPRAWVRPTKAGHLRSACARTRATRKQRARRS